MPSTAGFSPRLEGPEGMGAGAEQSSAVPPPHFPLAGLQAQTLYCELAPRAKTAKWLMIYEMLREQVSRK